jgi:hypothetical protein
VQSSCNLIHFAAQGLVDGVELAGEYNFVASGEVLNELYDLKHGLDTICVLEESSRESGVDALFFKNLQDLIFELKLCHSNSLRWIVERDIFIDPHPAFLIFIDEDHFIGDIEGSKSCEEPFKADDGLLHEVEDLEEGHFGQGMQGGVEVFDGDLDYWALIQ